MTQRQINWSRIVGWYAIAVVWLVLAGVQPITAQMNLIPNTPEIGTIAAPGETQNWTFAGREGGMVSLIAEGESGDLDPIVTLRDSTGSVLVTNDDFAYPGRTDALLQGITLPRNETYTVTVGGFANTTGDYTLTLFTGYADLQAAVNFNSNDEGWQASNSQLTVSENVGRLTLNIDGIREGGYAYASDSPSHTNFYVHVTVVNVIGNNGWVVGLVLRRDGNSYYLMELSHQGFWRMLFVDGSDEVTVRDWGTHPAIIPGATNFTLGVLVNGNSFDTFFNGAFIGQATDEQRFQDEGQVGLYTRTVDVLGSATTTEYDDFTVTIPLTVGDVPVMPNQLMPGGLALTIQELERRQVIPPGGIQALTVDQSSGREVNPGVNRIVLARGTTFGNMVFSTTFTMQADGGVVGCGLLFNNNGDDNHAIAYLDRNGGYGVSQRDGNEYLPGLFGESTNPDWRSGSQALLLVRLDDTVHYFVNRQYVGTTAITAVDGEVGNVVVNYEAMDTFCQFTDTWVWRLD